MTNNYDPRTLGALLNLQEDELRERIKEISPEIRHDVNVMADMIRELVRLERDKRGLDRQAGEIDLAKVKDWKKGDPHLRGSGIIAGKRYQAAAWAKGSKILDRKSVV